MAWPQNVTCIRWPVPEEPAFSVGGELFSSPVENLAAVAPLAAVAAAAAAAGGAKEKGDTAGEKDDKRVDEAQSNIG